MMCFTGVSAAFGKESQLKLADYRLYAHVLCMIMPKADAEICKMYLLHRCRFMAWMTPGCFAGLGLLHIHMHVECCGGFLHNTQCHFT